MTYMTQICGRLRLPFDPCPRPIINCSNANLLELTVHDSTQGLNPFGTAGRTHWSRRRRRRKQPSFRTPKCPLRPFAPFISGNLSQRQPASVSKALEAGTSEVPNPRPRTSTVNRKTWINSTAAAMPRIWSIWAHGSSAIWAANMCKGEPDLPHLLHHQAYTLMLHDNYHMGRS